MKVFPVLLALLVLILIAAAPGKSDTIPVGVASIETTPTEPIRLSGYGSRNTPSEGIDQKLHAKALAIGAGTEDEPLSVLITLDAIGIPAWMTKEVAGRLEKKKGVAREQFVIAATHTHSGPSLRGPIPYMFPSGFTEAEGAAVGRYSNALVDKLEKVALDAIAAREPSRLSWGKGKLTFAANRRVLEEGQWKGFGVQADGPVDHTMPILRVTNASGKDLATLVNYACHCTTLGGNYNRIHGDWAGEAQAEIEKRHPGMTAMIAIGCGADQNPEPRGDLEMVAAHGVAVADEVDRMLNENLVPLRSVPVGDYNEISLPLDELPDRAEWERQVAAKERNHHFAAAMLEKLDRGEKLATSVHYPIQTWIFGNDLAMVFLAGEVVVDYAHRLYRELDADRVWLNAYSNDVPCYLTSRRIYHEGGYEVDGSRFYYGIPARLRPDTEDRVCDEVIRQLPPEFYSAETLAVMPAPVEPEDALKTIRVADGYEVQLVAREPQTMDPVDLAWDSRGRIWVVEMADYPTGIDGEPGGRIRVLEDRDGDGFYETSTLFLDRLKYPNSVFPWRDGVIFVTADSIRFARDTDGDGRADEDEALFTGFESGNAQHQLGSLQWGLDNWIHVGNGDSKGSLVSVKTGQSIELGARDVRFDPDTGEVEALSGKAQFGITRDDWGNWFGCNNSKPWWHYALDDRDLARNPHVQSPDPKVLLTDEPIAGRVFPTSRTVARFNDYDKKSRFTSACGLHAAGDSLFVAEPVHNLVSRIVIEPRGATFTGKRTPTESASEFFSSTDNWCRPTAVRTGPDGSLYLVDMYRQVIEHPEWIPEAWQRRLNLRSGSERGRIYRIVAKSKSVETLRPVASLSGVDLATELESPSSTRRDLAHRELLWRDDPAALEHVAMLVSASPSPQARLHALSILERHRQLTGKQIATSLSDGHPAVRRHAVRLAAPDQALSLVDDGDAFVRQQLAYRLGESKSEAAGWTLAQLLVRDGDDPYLRAAILSSAVPHLESLAASEYFSDFPGEAVIGLVQTALGGKNETALSALLDAVPAHLESAALLAGTLQYQFPDKFIPVIEEAKRLAASPDESPEKRTMAIRLLHTPDTDLLLSLLDAREPAAVQSAALQQCSRLGSPGISREILARWSELGSQIRAEALPIFLERSQWVTLYLDRARDDPSLARGLDAAQRAGLLHHRDEAIRKSAGALFNADTASSRAGVLAQFAPALTLEPDFHSGEQLFASLCASCHQVGETGFQVGPDLTALSNLSREPLMTAIIDPNAAVESKYALYLAETADGRSVSGMLASETATGVTLLGAGGVTETINRSQLVSLRSPGISLMPEGLEAALDGQKMADLLGFLQSSATESMISPRDDGEIHLPAMSARTKGDTIEKDPVNDSLNWIAEGDSAEWSVAEVPAGTYSVFFDAATSEELDPASGRFGLTIGERKVEGDIETTNGLNRFRKRLFGEIRLNESLSNVRVEFRHDFPDGQVAIRDIVFAPRG